MMELLAVEKIDRWDVTTFVFGFMRYGIASTVLDLESMGLRAWSMGRVGGAGSLYVSVCSRVNLTRRKCLHILCFPHMGSL